MDKIDELTLIVDEIISKFYTKPEQMYLYKYIHSKLEKDSIKKLEESIGFLSMVVTYFLFDNELNRKGK